jgi:hypothetical protein
MDIREVGDWIGTGGLEVGIRIWIPAMKCRNLGLVYFYRFVWCRVIVTV